MRVVLELLRIIVVFAILGSLLGSILGKAYLLLDVNTEPFEWMGFIAIMLLLFVFYRNKLQFSGWYKGEGREKLSPKVTCSFIAISAILVVMAPVFSYPL
ncbi:hypothetical protein [Mesobacillus subterraneus]|uniref:Uncharacterized protein n=1 Tax=Mesobacillus subterraneus TaxID=285983 RepID=A0A3R9DXM4_9BACI|nr:hypothetical protein [Mesobacillus subterraneus]RSD29599.1 hypothetical protein EJA10_00370 [Mesobacillus subterraneus]